MQEFTRRAISGLRLSLPRVSLPELALLRLCASTRGVFSTAVERSTSVMHATREHTDARRRPNTDFPTRRFIRAFLFLVPTPLSRVGTIGCRLSEDVLCMGPFWVAVAEPSRDTALAGPAFSYVDFGVAHGLSRETLMQAAGLDERLRGDPDARVSTFAYMALWRAL